MIKFCACASSYQDKKYGKQQRVHNECIKDGKSISFRCTVCGTKKL